MGKTPKSKESAGRRTPEIIKDTTTIATNILERSDKKYTGYICLYRSIQDHWIWNDPQKLKWWIDILLTVNHTGKKFNIGGHIIECNRGQTITSLQTWSKRWRVHKSKVNRFLKLLQSDNMIVTENVLKTTRVTVCNYDTYNGFRNDNETIIKPSRNNLVTTVNPNNNELINVNNDNNDNGFEEAWNLYDKKINKENAYNEWMKISNEDRQRVLAHIPGYINLRPDKKYRKNLENYLKEKLFNDSIANTDFQESKRIDIQTLYNSFLNGFLDVRLIAVKHYDELINLIQLSDKHFEKAKQERMEDLYYSLGNQLNKDLYSDYKSNIESDRVKNDFSIINNKAKRFAVLDFFSQSKNSGIKNILNSRQPVVP